MTAGLRFGWELSGSGWATVRIADSVAEHKEDVSESCLNGTVTC